MNSTCRYDVSPLILLLYIWCVLKFIHTGNPLSENSMALKIRNVFHCLALLLLAGCGSRSDSTIITFDNDFEGLKGWCSADHLYEGKGHSGRFCTVTDAQTPYGSIFRIKFKDIDKAPLTFLRFSAWCYSEGPPGEARLVVSVDSDTSQSIVWHGWPLADQR
jgi:hypothetical protein